MNKENEKDYLPLVQALAEGKVIQIMRSDGWIELPDYDFTSPVEHYRIKPEPREIWSNRYSNGYETSACFLSKVQALDAAYTKNVKQVCYREVIE